MAAVPATKIRPSADEATLNQELLGALVWVHTGPELTLTTMDKLAIDNNT